MIKKVIGKILKFLFFLFFSVPFNLFLKWWLPVSLERKTKKYDKQFKPMVLGTSLSFFIFFSLVILYFFPGVLYFLYGFLNEKTLQDILQVGFTVFGVGFGVFLQQLIEFLILPDKEVIHPLKAHYLFNEFISALEEFSLKIKDDKKGLLDDEKTNITILLSSPILVDFDEIDKIIKNKVDQIRFEELIKDIFNSSKKFKREIICLSPDFSQFQGFSPLQRFIKTFSGYIVSTHFQEIDKSTFYEKVDTFRRNLIYKIRALCQSTEIKSHMKFAKEDDLQWQAIVIDAPQLRFYKAVVGFYGEDFFKKYSRLDLMSGIKNALDDTDNQGFISDEPDIVKWVMDGLVKPYIPDKKQKVEFPMHHSSGVHREITEKVYKTGGKVDEVVMMDNSKTLTTINVSYSYGENTILQEIDYPVYDGASYSPIKIKYCQPLFHPLIAESATWSSLNIRLPGNNSRKVLDMCCGIGVQGLAAIDRGAIYVHGVDNDPISLLCAIENYKRKINGKNGSIEIKVTLAEGFEKVLAKDFDEFENTFKKSLENLKLPTKIEGESKELTNTQKEELIKLFNSNESIIKQFYTNIIPKDFNLIILEPPFVEFSEDPSSPSHDSLYDKHFQVTRSLLKNAKEYLMKFEGNRANDWEKPYVMQSFSSLENIIELEDYIEKVAGYQLFRKSSIKKNNVYWYCYHLIPNNMEG